MPIEEQGQLFINITKLSTFHLYSSSSPVPIRTRTVINVIYISGIVFMIIVFLTLLWVNLYSRRCWCWHDTPLINRFNRECLIRRSMNRNAHRSSSNNHHRQRSFPDDEIP